MIKALKEVASNREESIVVRVESGRKADEIKHALYEAAKGSKWIAAEVERVLG